MLTDQEVFDAWYKEKGFSNQMAQAEIARNQEIARRRGQPISNTMALKEIGSRGVCPSCEAVTYRCSNDGKTSQCPSCGRKGPTVTLDEYLKHKMYR